MATSPEGISTQSQGKQSLRKQLRAARRNLSDVEQVRAAAGLLDNLLTLPELQSAVRIAFYLQSDGEIDPSGLIPWCADHQRNPFLPVVRQQDGRNSLRFAPVTSDTQFNDNRFGIPEPVVDEAALVDARDLDLVLLPLVGFDDTGNRIGMGGGFYDTTFEFVSAPDVSDPPVMIGLAHDLQRVPAIDAERWDIPLSTVVTDRAVYRLGQTVR